jgi:ferric-dicitrate binding protein FerR (iron transport regulator)
MICDEIVMPRRGGATGSSAYGAADGLWPLVHESTRRAPDATRHTLVGEHGTSKRITAMSLATGALIAIVNSTVWAIASSYMVRQRMLTEIARARNYVVSDGHESVHEKATSYESVPVDEDLVAPSI